jgi:hypothetical protein
MRFPLNERLVAFYAPAEDSTSTNQQQPEAFGLAHLESFGFARVPSIAQRLEVPPWQLLV